MWRSLPIPQLAVILLLCLGLIILWKHVILGPIQPANPNPTDHGLKEDSGVTVNPTDSILYDNPEHDYTSGVADNPVGRPDHTEPVDQRVSDAVQESNSLQNVQFSGGGDTQGSGKDEASILLRPGTSTSLPSWHHIMLSPFPQCPRMLI
jgi:hypothetical protein